MKFLPPRFLSAHIPMSSLSSSISACLITVTSTLTCVSCALLYRLTLLPSVLPSACCHHSWCLLRHWHPYLRRTRCQSMNTSCGSIPWPITDLTAPSWISSCVRDVPNSQDNCTSGGPRSAWALAKLLATSPLSWSPKIGLQSGVRGEQRFG